MAISKLQGRLLRDPLLAPASIALVGASDDISKTAARPLQYLLRAGFKGRIYPVNPSRETVLGRQAWPSVTALPETPDHAFILTPTGPALKAIAECAECGVKVATVLASGFSEAGEAGHAKVEKLRALLDGQSMRVIGPSSMGVVNILNSMPLTANAAFAEPELPKGHTLVGSHSGSVIGALASRGKARGFGFAGMISVGNEVDLSMGEICESTLDDPDIDSYLLFLETLNDAPALRRFAQGAAERGKPVVAYKLGRTAAAAELVISHTGALSGPDEIADAFFRASGIVRVDTLEGALEALPLVRKLSKTRKPRSFSIGVVTTTGGGAAMLVDQLGVKGVTVQPASAATVQRLSDHGVEATCGRIIDLTLAGANYDTMRTALSVLTSAPEFDLVVTVAGSSARFQPDLAVRPVIDAAAEGANLATFVVPEAPEALQQLAQAEVPCFRTPEGCSDAIAAVLRSRPPALMIATSAISSNRTRTVDELEGYALLDQLGIPRSPAVEHRYGEPAPTTLPFAYPVAVKVLSADIAHKSDVGGVILGVADKEALQASLASLSERVSQGPAGKPPERALIQPMAQNAGPILAEVLIGYRVDHDVGPVVILAAGGVLAEIYQDKAVRLAPVDLAEAFSMIAEVKALQTLSGYRGMRLGDLDALASALCALSQLAVRSDIPAIEAEVNPLLVRPKGQGVTAVDALFSLAVSDA
jgi:acyl-CoA synthetase (NDP forming)